MKRIFLLVAMTFITSLASAQITSEQYNQINFKVSQQTMIEQLQSYGFDYNYYGNIGGMIDNELIEITFKTSQNGVIEEMRVIEMKSLDEREYAARVAELKEIAAGICRAHPHGAGGSHPCHRLRPRRRCPEHRGRAGRPLRAGDERSARGSPVAGPGLSRGVQRSLRPRGLRDPGPEGLLPL